MSLLDYIIAPIPLRQTFVIASRVVINGSFSCEGSGVIIGRINGDVTVDGKITLAKKGFVNGSIKADSMTLKGTVTGNIYCEGKMMVASSAHIKGNIVTSEIDVEKNAIIEGSITKLTPKNITEERNYFIETSMAKNAAVIFSEEIATAATIPNVDETPAPIEKAAQTWF